MMLDEVVSMVTETSVENQQIDGQNSSLLEEVQDIQAQEIEKIDININSELEIQQKCVDQDSKPECPKLDNEYLLCAYESWEKDADIFKKCFGVKFFVPGDGKNRKRSPISSVKSRRKRKKLKENQRKDFDIIHKHARLNAEVGSLYANADRLTKEVLTLSEQCDRISSPNSEFCIQTKNHSGVIGPPPKLINLITLGDDEENTTESPDSTNVSKSRDDTLISTDSHQTQIHSIVSNATISFANSHQTDEMTWIPQKSKNLPRKQSRIHSHRKRESKNLIDLTTDDEEQEKNSAVRTGRAPASLNTVNESSNAHLSRSLHQIQTVTPPPAPAPVATDIRCESCGLGFQNQEDLDLHSKSHRAGKSFHCHPCDQTFMNKLSYLYHTIQHTNDQPHTCHICSMEFQSDKELRMHQRGHKTGKQYFCETCGETFVHKLEYLYHAMKHQGLGPFKCSICDVEFPRNEDLTRHNRTHRTRKSHKCEECGEMFCRKLDLLYHAVEHKAAEQSEKMISL